MTKYKMRAECSIDLGRFLAKVPVNSFTAKRINDFADMEATFTTILELSEIKKIMRKIVDGHVMVETVALAKDYTGERK